MNFFKKLLKKISIDEEILELDIISKAQIEKVYEEKIKTSYMIQFTEIEYNLNCEIHNKDTSFIILDEYNKNIAKKDFNIINKIVQDNVNISNEIDHYLQIPIEEVMFHEFKENYGFSKLICTPYTPTGKIAKYPVHLFFTTADYVEYECFNDGIVCKPKFTSTHGWIYYTKNGNIGKADIIFSRKGVIYAYGFKSNLYKLYINKIEKIDTKSSEYNKKIIFKKV